MKSTTYVDRFLKIFLALLVACGINGDYSAISKVVGNPNYLDPLLVPLVKPLDAKGIDVVANGGFQISLSERPRVAQLSGMHIVQSRDYSSADWMKGFVEGVDGFIAGVKIAPENPSDNFLNDWQQAPPEKRVFISFTSRDLDYAERVRQVLVTQGYVAFVFLNNRQSNSSGPGKIAPTYNEQLVGKMFAQAGHHLVIDTPNARKSPGVFLEARLMAKLLTDGGTPPPPPPKSDLSSLALGMNNFNENEFVSGITHEWIVTENPSKPGILFVHRTQRDGALIDLLYLVRVERNGDWTIYKPDFSRRDFRVQNDALGTRLGSIRPPPGVDIGSCTCTI